MGDGTNINQALTRRVAALARLHLTEAETQTFTQQLSQILGYIEKLQEVDVQGVSPLIHPFPQNTPLRPDVPRAVPQPAEQDSEEGGFQVPSII